MKSFAEHLITEIAAPGMRTWIKHRTAEFKKRYGEDWKKVLYSTSWSFYHKHREGKPGRRKNPAEIKRQREKA